MSKDELFKKYKVDESHSEWNPMIDNWMSVEVYRAMHNGALPEPGDTDPSYITDFLDKANADPKFPTRYSNAGSMYLTAKRMVYRYADQILTARNIKEKDNA